MSDGVQLTSSELAITAIITRILKTDILLLYYHVVLAAQLQLKAMSSYKQSKSVHIYVVCEYAAMVMLLPPCQFNIIIINHHFL